MPITDPRLAGISYRFEVEDRTYDPPCPTRQYLRVTGADQREAQEKVHAHYCDERGYRPDQRASVDVRFLGYNINGHEVTSLDVLLSVERHGESGWAWEVQEFSNEGDLPVLRYRTDGNGQGLWQWRLPPGQVSPSWVQVKGHLSSHLYASSPGRAARQLRERHGFADRKVLNVTEGARS